MLKNLILAVTLFSATALAPLSARAEWTYSCNHCQETLLYQGKGHAETCPKCSELNVLTTCQDCSQTWALSHYGDWTCSSCRRAQSVSQCPYCRRQSVGSSYEGWTRCPYGDCGLEYFALYCGSCSTPMTSFGSGWITCPKCSYVNWRR